jgi:hypothetical protein
MISIWFVVLHTGQGVSLVEYLFRVLVYLTLFTGIGVTVFWVVRMIEIVQSKIDRRGRINDDGS